MAGLFVKKTCDWPEMSNKIRKFVYYSISVLGEEMQYSSIYCIPTFICNDFISCFTEDKQVQGDLFSRDQDVDYLDNIYIKNL